MKSSYLLRLGGTLVAGLALLSAAFADVVPSSGKAAVVRGPRLNTRSILPQIIGPESVGPVRRPSNPKKVLRLFAGEPNNLPVGKQLDQARITLDRSTQFPALDQRGGTPPDPDLAVSRTHAVAVVNTDIGFYSLPSGGQLFRQSFGTFFQGVAQSSFLFDPKAFYDPGTGRFFVVCLEVNDDGTAGNNRSALLLAVSDDADPRGVWNRFRVDSRVTINGVDTWFDYPGFGFNRDRIVLSGNHFTFGAVPTFQASVVFSIPKADLVGNRVPTVTRFVMDSDFTIQWAQTPLDLTEATNYGVSLSSSASARILALTGPVAAPVMNRVSISIPNFTFGDDRVDGPGGEVDALEARFLNAMWANGSMVTAHTIPQGEQHVSRWYEFRTNGWPASSTPPTLRQSGEVASPGASVFMPAVGLNRVGDIVMTASRRGPSTPADHILTGRRATDPLGAMGRTTVAFRSTGTGYNQFRWGDYFGVQVDPRSQRDFWAIAMTVKPSNEWSTNVARIRVSAGDETGLVYSAISANPLERQGTLISGTTQGLNVANDASTLSVRSVSTPQGFVATIEAAFNLADIAPSQIESIAIPVVATGPASATGQLFAYNWNERRYELLTQSAFGLTGQNLVFNIENITRFVNPDTRRMQVVLRSLQPRRTGSNYTLVADRLQVVVTPREN